MTTEVGAHPLERWLLTSPLRWVLVVMTGVAGAAYVFAMVRDLGPFAAGDAQIYAEAARRLLRGETIYEFANSEGFGFTYPTFAAIFLATVGWLPGGAAPNALQVIGLASLVGMVWLMLRDLGWGRRGRWFGVALVLPGLLALYPVMRSISSGQVDLVLALALAVDFLALRSSRFRGFLTGVAGAIKLTPAAFALYFLVTRDWKSLWRSIAGFLSATGLAFLVAPKDSLAYWTTYLPQTDRVGSQAAALNQSWAGVVTRFQPSRAVFLEGGGRVVWIVLALLTVALCGILISRAARLGPQTPAFVATGLMVLLISPISWLHHWSFVAAPLVLALVMAQRRSGRTLAIVAALGVPVLAVAPWWLFGSVSEWGAMARVLGSMTVYWAVAYLVALFLWVNASAGRTPRRAAG